jgi:tRNA pseudouridine38-40 synthase
MARYKAVVEYDGTDYCGFQHQSGQPTVQAVLEQGIANLAGQRVRLLAAGRTDSGVHALGQVVAFDLAWRHGTGSLLRALNANLPGDVAVRSVSEASAAFHPRFDATKRTYVYHVYNQSLRSPLHRRYSWHVARPLDTTSMHAAADLLVGSRDFATFGQAPQGENTVREVFSAGWRKRGAMLIFEVEANAFLHRMVRSIVGALKLVGDGTWAVTDFEAALEARDRSRAGQSAPPQGLYLLSVAYD